MSVEIEPSELSFQQPFTRELSQYLKITNLNKFPIAFKVKTTAPKQYCVRPNSGRVEPGQDVEVNVLLQAMKQEPGPGTKCRDKFLVQSAPITADKEFASIVHVASILEKKIRVNWIPADQSSLAATTPSRTSAGDNSTSGTPDVTRTFSSPNEESRARLSPPPPYDADSAASKEEDVRSEHDQSVVSAAASAVTHNAQLTYEEIKEKLAQAEAKIRQLQQDSGLRQRVKNASEKVQASSAKQAAAVQQTVEGVPVQLVALLCLISFLLAYFVF
ncbi:MSP domain-containing protein [Sodiomyces alkalinus F11]|uniref:MSP domain-containing protein n=1 Tax=Sodiomyces alkalinus (strain CBS 110278 / VKM F-3762 / F11) TaxID=1314773 RepID=A0A3N2Q438_SODAK|nr:MSP domain-containing protein [Sodiomyces alkalinus F11]ROT41523.1 MSP domain-containing protein [Sodiomyces alkalinus F11]